MSGQISKRNQEMVDYAQYVDKDTGLQVTGSYSNNTMRDAKVMQLYISVTDPTKETKDRQVKNYGSNSANVPAGLCAKFYLHEDATNCGLGHLHGLYSSFNKNGISKKYKTITLEQIYTTLYNYLTKGNGIMTFGHSPGSVKSVGIMRMSYAQGQGAGSLEGWCKWLKGSHKDQVFFGPAVRNPNSGSRIQEVTFVPVTERIQKRDGEG